jgi:PAT family beta-lactamase induction signal transducer AmpG
MSSSNLLHSRRGRFFAFGTMYIAEGIPFGFSITAMVMFMRMEGLSIEQVGAFTAAVMLPWGFKWAWAPLIDIVKLTRLGGRKAWIMICLVAMMITLNIMASVDFVANYQVLIWMVVINNFFCATQDVAIDSLAVSTLKDDERGTGNGFMFGGQYLGLALGGGGAIFVSANWGFNQSLVYVSGLLLLCLLFVVFFINDPAIESTESVRPERKFAHFIATLGAFIRSLYTGFFESGAGPKLGLLFAILPIGALALGYAILGTIQVDYGLEQNQIAKISVMNTIAGGIGCLIGGTLGDRFGIKRVMAFFYVTTALPTLYLAFSIATMGLSAVPIDLLYSVIVMHGLLYGAAFALHAAVFMGMTSPAVAATQFTAYMALSNLAISFANVWQGVVAERMGYSMALYLDSLFVISPLLVIPFLRDREDEAVPAAIDASPVVG